MHVQPVDVRAETATCPECRTLQNVDAIWQDEEKDLMSGQRCWYCGHALEASHVQPTSEFNVVFSGVDVPSTVEAVSEWTHALEHQFGSKPTAYNFDDAGRCVVAMHRIETDADDLDVAVE